MTMLYSSQGTITFPIAAGNTLVVNNISGIETVTGSGSSREDVSANFGSGRVAYGPQASAVTITLSTTGQCDYEIRVGDVTPASDDPSLLSTQPDLPTLIAAYPAASNAGKTALVGDVMYYSNGSDWVQYGSGSSDTTITQRDASGNVTQYVEAGVTWNVSYDANGDVSSLLRG